MKNEQSRLIALLDDYDRTMELQAIATDSAGQAELQFAKYQDTVESKINKVKTAWEELRQSLLNSDEIKKILDIVVSTLNKINDFDFSKTTLLLTAGFAPAVKNIINNIISQLKNSAINLREIGFNYAQNFREGFNSNDLSVQIKVEITQAQAALNELEKELAQVQAQTKQGLGTPELIQKEKQLKDAIANSTKELEYKTAQMKFADATTKIFKGTISSVTSALTSYAIVLMNGGDAESAFKAALVTLIPQLISMTLEFVTSAAKIEVLNKRFQKNTNEINLNSGAYAVNTSAVKANTKARKKAIMPTQNLNTQLMLTGTSGESAAKGIGSLLGKIGGKGGIAAAIAIAVAELAIASYQIYKTYKEYKEAISVTNQLEKATEKLTEAQRNYSEALDETKTQRSEIKNLNEAVDTYEKLYNLTNRTDDQENQLNSAIDTIVSEYPEIISYYDEENNKLSINNELYEQKIELLKEEKKQQDEITNFYNQQQIQLKKEQAILQSMSTIESQTGLKLNAQEGQSEIQRISNVENIDEETLKNFWENILDESSTKDISFNIDDAKTAWNYLYNDIEDETNSLDKEVKVVLNGWKQQLIDINKINNNFSDYYSNVYQDLLASGKYQNEQYAGIAAAVIAGVQDGIDNISIGDTSGQVLEESLSKWAPIGYIGGQILGNNPITGVVGSAITSYFSKKNVNVDMTDTMSQMIQDIKGKDIGKEAADELAQTYQDVIYDITNDFGINAFEEWESLEPETKKLLKKIGIDSEDLYNDYIEGFTTDAALSDKLTKDIINSEISSFQEKIKEDLQAFFDDIKGQTFLEDAANFINEDMYESTNEEILNKIENFKAQIKEVVPNITDEVLNQILTGMGIDSGLLGEDKIHPAFQEAAELLGKEVETYKDEISLGLAQAINSANAKIIEDTDSKQLAKDMVSSLENELSSSNLSDKVQQIFYGIDWTTFDIGTMNLDDFLEDIADANNLTDEERKGLQKIAEIAQNYGQLDTMVDTLAEAQDYVKTLSDTMKTLYEDQSSYVSVITEQINDGEVSLESYLNLKDKLLEQGLNPQDYFDIDSMGKITTNEETIKKLYEDQIAAKKQQLEIKLNEAEIQKSELENQLVTLNAQIASIKEGNGLISIYNDQIYQTGLIAQNWYTILSLISEITGKDYSMSDYKINLSGVNSENQAEILNILESQAKLVETQIEGTSSSIDILQKEYDNFDNEAQAYWRDFNKNIQDGIEENDKLADSLDKVNEAQEKVIEAQNELNEALYGEKYHKNALDFMYNYETALEAVQRTADKTKETLDDLSTDDDIGKNLQDYQNAIHQEAVLLNAESAEYQQAIDNYESVIKNRLKGKLEEINAMDPSFNVNTDIADYLYQDEDGMYYINYDALNLANIPDDFSDFLEESADQMNEWVKAILDNEDKLAEREKEIEEMHEQAIDNRVSLEDKVQEILKEKYEEEISDVEEKYSAMEEANDEYLDALEDALQKERDLRERSNQWEELAQKEKKLSLMQRDTSGANQTDVLNLQNEIQEDREQLLDDTVDDILETLKEQYELQKEAHEQEIEFMNTITEDSNLSAMAAEVINSWPSYEAALDWFYQNDQEFADASDAKREQLTNEWIDLYNKSKMYDQMNYDEMKDALNTTDQEIQLKMDEITETATTEGERALNETSDKVKQEISDAKEALAQALEDLADAQEAYAEAISEGLKYSALSGGSNDDSDSSQKNSGNTKAYNTRLEAETAARTLAQAGNTGITIDEKDGKYYVNYTKKSTTSSQNTSSQNTKSDTPVNKPSTTVDTENSTTTMPANFLNNQYPDLAKKDDSKKWRWSIPDGWGEGYFYFSTKQNLERTIDNIRKKYPSLPKSSVEILNPSEWNKMWGHNSWSNANIDKGHTYASGGLVDYTGPAWVDGTKSNPEAFLSSEDTRRIGEAAELLSKLPILNSTSTSETQMASSIGDTSIEIHINIDKIESDYDVDDMIERVRQDIVDVANPTGTVQILRK